MLHFERRRLFFVFLLVVGCGSSSPAPKTAPSAVASVLEVNADPNGLWWDAAEATLYVADAHGNRILSWTDAGGFSVFRELPAAPSSEGTGPEHIGLGQVVRMNDGSLVVTRFGFGRRGDVVVVPPQGEAHVVPGLDATRRRIGLTQAPDGKLYDAWFAKLDSGRAGAVSQLSLEGTESEVMTGLTKPVGVLVDGDQLFVSDQDLGQILVARLADPGSHRVFASLPHPDLLAMGPDGSIFAGSSEGNVYRIGASGEVRLLQGGFAQVRGVAYDAARHRLFVANHSATEQGSEKRDLSSAEGSPRPKRQISILPVE